MSKNKKYLLLSLCLYVMMGCFSQVTIGSGEMPTDGALLQLKNIDNITDDKANATKGLALPRVELSNLTKLQIGDNNELVSTERENHIGLLVYNTSQEPNACLRIAAGMYVWDGNSWNALTDNDISEPISRENILHQGVDDNISWVIDKSMKLTVCGSGIMKDYFWLGPSPPWYNYRAQITALEIREGITGIGNYAFQGFLKASGSLTFPKSVEVIGGYAFASCGRLSGDLIIPNTVKRIKKGAFYNCHLFDGDLVISSSMTEIEDNVFDECDGFRGELRIPNSITTIGRGAFQFCKFGGSLNIPHSVTEIGQGAFQFCEFTGNLIIPNSVTSIGDDAFFANSNIDGYLHIPSSLTTIGEAAFGATNITIINCYADESAFATNDTFASDRDLNLQPIYTSPNRTLHVPTTAAGYNQSVWTRQLITIVKDLTP